MANIIPISKVKGLQAALNGLQTLIVPGTNFKTFGGQSPLGAGDISLSSSGNSSQATLPYDISNATTTAGLNADIAASTKTMLIVYSPTVTLTSKLSISGKTNFTLMGLNTTLLLNTDTANGNKGVLLDIQGNTNLTITGFTFNCTLPNTSTDGAGYGMVTVNPGTVLSGLTIRQCKFTCPNYDQNAFSAVMYASGVTGGMLTNVSIYDNDFYDIKRMAIEITNQEINDNASPSSRYNTVRIIGNRARNLGVNGGVNGMFVSLDGLGTDNYIGFNQVINPKFFCYEIVSNLRVNLEANSCDYTPDYTALFSAYSFTDGGHGVAAGAQNIVVNGGSVRATERGINLSRVSTCTFYNVDVVSGKGNNWVQATGCGFYGGSMTGKDNTEYLNAFQNGSTGNEIMGARLVNLRSTGQGAGCIAAFFGSGDIGNKLIGNHMVQQRNSSNGFYEASLINVQTNVIQDNINNNP